MRTLRNIADFKMGPFCKNRSDGLLPHVVYSHSSLIRRRLGSADMRLQENKATNLKIAAGKINGVIIYPGEIFSFWHLVGSLTRKKGYKEGVTISNGRVCPGVGGGMCQFTNLIHFMVLHSPLKIIEHHHHDGLDLFPDFGRKVPFGTGTSIVYNYLDYRLKNETDAPYQIVAYVDEEYLRGELRSVEPLGVKYHIRAEGEGFKEENGVYYREGRVFRDKVDKATGNLILREVIKENHAKVMYDAGYIDKNRILY